MNALCVFCSVLTSLALLHSVSAFIFPPTRSKSNFRRHACGCLNSAARNDVEKEELAVCAAFGGDLVRIDMKDEEDGFLAKNDVPTFAARPASTSTCDSRIRDRSFVGTKPTRMGLEGVVPGAFILRDALPVEDCEEMISVCENKLKFGSFSAGKNNHGAMQIVVTDSIADRVSRVLSRHINIQSFFSLPSHCDGNDDMDVRHTMAGINRRWRIYRYDASGNETFAPHIDAGFPPSGLSDDGTELIWDITTKDESRSKASEEIVSRLTVLMYLNDDFVGGETNFYAPKSEQEQENPQLLASIKPKAGSILVFPQAVGEEAVEFARSHWPLHEGSAVTSGTRPKYVIRSDVLFATTHGLSEEEKDDVLFQHDNAVRQAFLPRSPALDEKFLSHLSSLYNPHMGVENLGPLLYSFVRFSKVRKIVEIGAGYTSLWLLQALRDNDNEMKLIRSIQQEGKCRLLDYPWAVPQYVEDYVDSESSLLCIDNCLHQRETATGAAAVAKALDLDKYFRFIQGDAFDMQFEPETIDLLWCDFGVGRRMKEFAPSAWRSVRPGGFLICHSTLTNRGTREWLEAARAHKDETGIPADEFVELSLLEPHKCYQNSISVFQRRKSQGGEAFEEPIYSEYA